MNASTTIANDRLSVRVAALGAELQSLCHADAGELLWQAGPVWPKHAPVLFPIVGQLPADRYRYRGATYSLPRHGFAREREFAWLERSGHACRLELRDDAATRAVFPFAFRFEVRYVLDGDTCTMTLTLQNPSPSEFLHASLGAHPAFAWPLPGNADKRAHRVVFERDEAQPVRRLRENLLDPVPVPTPVTGRTLALAESLFTADALIFDRLSSHALTYEAPGTPSLACSWSGFAELGIWSKAGGDFVCIEPWHGYASPLGFDGDFADKPGLMHLPPGTSRVCEFRVRVSA